jgi:sugar phosphate permease
MLFLLEKGEIMTTQVVSRSRVPAQRIVVFAAVLFVNLVVWMDSAKTSILVPYWSRDLHLGPPQISSILSSYLLGYFPMLFLAGMLADRLGAKRLLLICVAGVAVLSASMAFVTTYEEMWVRNLIFGIFFGLLWAPCNRLIAVWFPGHERAKYAAIWMSSTLLSSIIVPPIALPIAAHISWQAAFLVVAGLAVPAFIYFLIVVTDQPEKKRGISPEELSYIQAGREEDQGHTVTWRQIFDTLKRPSIITMIIATGLATTPTWLNSWTTYGLITLRQINPDIIAVASPLLMLIPVVYGFFNGWVVNHIFKGHTRYALATGPVFAAVGFLLVALLNPPSYILWLFLLSSVVFMVDPLFWGTINAYWAGIAAPELGGTLNGISAALQVAVGYVILDQSGKWLNTAAQGTAQLTPVWIVGGIIALLAILPVLLSKEVIVARTPSESLAAPGGSQAGR